MYISRNGNEYYLYSKLTSKGNIKYYFSTKIETNQINEIPKGFETYESPDGNVTLRKVFEHVLDENEKTIISNAIKKVCKNVEYILDDKKDGIGIYIDETYGKKVSVLELSYLTLGISRSNKVIFNPTFKVYKDKLDKEYYIERFCYLGGSMDWIYIDKSKNLKVLCEKYFIHIGKESFYELI
jgi:hypothetical protein